MSAWRKGWGHQLLKSHLSGQRGQEPAGAAAGKLASFRKGGGSLRCSPPSLPLCLPSLLYLEARGQEVEVKKQRIHTNVLPAFLLFLPLPHGAGVPTQEARPTNEELDSSIMGPSERCALVTYLHPSADNEPWLREDPLNHAKPEPQQPAQGPASALSSPPRDPGCKHPSILPEKTSWSYLGF